MCDASEHRGIQEVTPRDIHEGGDENHTDHVNACNGVSPLENLWSNTVICVSHDAFIAKDALTDANTLAVERLIESPDRVMA